MNNKKCFFSAVFEKYEQGSDILNLRVVVKNIRTREGSVVKESYVFDEETSKKIQGYLTLGEYLVFLADIQFKDIEFQYPHGTKI